MLTSKTVPYTGRYASTKTKLPSKGETVLALKIALKRLRFLDDANMDQVWREGMDVAFRKWQRSVDLPGHGVYGQQEWKAMRRQRLPSGEYALNKQARQLIRKDRADQLKELAEERRDLIRKFIAEFCVRAEANEDRWHYSQARPVDVSVDPRASYVRSDCSGYVIQAYYYARTKTGFAVPDPSKQNWTGYGNTDYYEDDHPPVTNGRYLVGDLAHYHGHVSICRRAGSATTAVFSSHGSEAGPVPTSLHYRGDLRKVVRPSLL
jgi:hypothetical protein